MKGRVTRLVIGFGLAGVCAVTLARMPVLASDGEYNDNPTICHHASMTEIAWWLNRCWLPDPPSGEPM